MPSLPIVVRLLPCLLVAAAAVGAGVVTAKPSPAPDAAATAFLETLRPEQRAEASFAYLPTRARLDLAGFEDIDILAH